MLPDAAPHPRGPKTQVTLDQVPCLVTPHLLPRLLQTGWSLILEDGVGAQRWGGGRGEASQAEINADKVTSTDQAHCGQSDLLASFHVIWRVKCEKSEARLELRGVKTWNILKLYLKWPYILEREPLRFCKCVWNITFPIIPFQYIYIIIKCNLAQHQKRSCKYHLSITFPIP